MTTHYALTPRTFLFSHYFYTGLRIATGVIGLTLITFFYSDLPTAMAVGIGALCTSLMDLPSPLSHKFNELLAGVLLCSAVALIVSICTPVRWLLGTMVVLVTFLASMMVVYGKKAIPLQFAALFIMALSMENAVGARDALLRTGLFFLGGMAFLGYAMAVACFMQRRTKQQILAEALYELARYVDLKADFYDVNSDLNTQFENLVRQQILVAEKQQASRDMLLRGRQEKNSAALVQVHYVMLDLYELVLSTHTDYALLRKHFAGSNALRLLGQLVRKAGADIESVAYAVTRNRVSFGEMTYQSEIAAIEREFEALQQSTSNQRDNDALALLRAAFNKMRAMIDTIAELHRATQEKTVYASLVSGANLTPFLTQQRYELNVLIANLRWRSPTFRYALRVAMAISIGLLLAEFLPYKAHGYWIALTIAVILKPTFGTTKRRRSDRLLGTLIGCILSALILHYVHNLVALMVFLFLATTAAPAFVSLKYRYTAIAASMQILLLISLTVPHGGNAISERLLDTLIGAAIASFFSYVLPSWEYRALPQLMRNVLKANVQFVEASKAFLQGRTVDDFLYRLARKRFMDSLASLSAALMRMLDEPAAKQHATAELNRFIVQNYLVAAHFAALRVLIHHHRNGLPTAFVNAKLDDVARCVQTLLARALNALDSNRAPDAASAGAGCVSGAPAPNVAGAIDADAHVLNWTGYAQLGRRSKLLYLDAEQINDYSRAIAQSLGTVR
jgi:uncharacterized membrane protein YccC